MNRQNERGIALITTLIMLSLVTFLSVAFLTLTRQERATVQAQTDITVAEEMNRGAVDRATAELVSRMLGTNSRHQYDMMVSTNYHRGSEFLVPPNNGGLDNVSYTNLSGLPLDRPNTRRNLLNLFYDPRAPVYVNADYSEDASGRATYDRHVGGDEFRYYIDFNRNGKFEPTGLIQNTNQTAPFVGDSATPGLVNRVGDPHWIGVLDRPNWRHDGTNRFVGRYAFIVQPTGKSLNVNEIHNQAKLLGLSSPTLADEAYVRNQGVGDWELNMAGFLAELNTNAWNSAGSPYAYDLFLPSSGFAFADSRDLSRQRYDLFPDALPPYSPGDFRNLFSYGYQYNLGSSVVPQSYFWRTTDRYDMFGNGPLNVGVSLQLGILPPQIPVLPPVTGDDFGLLDVGDSPWFGSPMPSPFFDIQELLIDDGSRVYDGFAARLRGRMRLMGHYDRYTLYRLMAQMGTDSSDPYTNKFHLNYLNWLPENTSLSSSGYTNYNRPLHLPDTFFNPWLQSDAFGTTNFFFGFVADTLLKKRFGLSFHDTRANNQGRRTSIAIPVWDINNPSNLYTAAIHQTLQLAANIYDSTSGQNYREWERGANYVVGNRVLLNGLAYEATAPSVGLPAPHQNPAAWRILPHMPSVFRPQFDVITDAMNNVVRVQITNYVQQLGTNFLANRWYDLNIPAHLDALRDDMTPLTPNTGPNGNLYGVPLVVGAKKGLPNFNEFGLLSRVTVGRKIEVVKDRSGATDTYTTNLMYTLGVTNRFFAEAWNSYTQAYPNPLRIHFRHAVHGEITNSGGTQLKSFAVTNLPAVYDLNADVWGGGLFVPLESRSETLMGAEQYVRSGVPDYFVPVGSLPTNSLFERYDPSIFDVPDWHLTATHRMAFWIIDTAQNQVVDVVSLNDLTSYFDLTRTLLDRTSLSGMWETNRPGGTNDIGVPPFGVLEQLAYAGGYRGISETEWDRYPGQGPTAEQAQSFRAFFNPSDRRTVMQAPFEALRSLSTATSWGANDPLVHYTREDLTDLNRPTIIEVIEPPNVSTILTNNFRGLNDRYSPWGGRRAPGNAVSTNSEPEHLAYNLALKDPGVRWPDDWNFPTHKMGNPGWLGRVHRGTPWQTVYLKAHMAPLIEPLGLQDYSWRRWAGTSLTHPTNDWELMDLFTTAPSPSAARGLLSINQTNDAAWYAALSGLLLLTNVVDDLDIGPLTNGMNPLNAIVLGPDDPTTDPNEDRIRAIVNGITRLRNSQSNGVFTNLGQILAVEELSAGGTNINNPVSPTTFSPVLNRGFLGDEFFSEQEQYGISDAVYERLPQQLMGLLKMEDHPRLTIYSWGQTLKPARRSVILTPGPLRGLVTNYQVTAEVSSKSLVRVEGVNPVFGIGNNSFRSLFEVRTNPQNIPMPNPPVFDLLNQDRIRIGRIAFRLRHSQRMMGRINGTPVRFYPGGVAGDVLPTIDPDRGGPLPAGPIQAGRIYYIVNARADDFQFSLSPNGVPVDLIDIGQGIHRISTVPRTVVEDHSLLYSED